MDEPRTVKLITREEIAQAIRESKRPGVEVILGAAGGLIQQAIDARTHAEAFDWSAGVEAALIGAGLLWAFRLVLNVWRAPRAIAAEDRTDLEQAYARLQQKYEDARRRLARRADADNATAQTLFLLHMQADEFVKHGTSQFLHTPADLANWWQRVVHFKDVLFTFAAKHLTNAEYAEVSSAFSVFPNGTSPHHLNETHAQMWERLRAVSKTLKDLLAKYESASRSR